MTDKKHKSVGGVEGILRGLGDLVEKLGDLAEKGEQLKQGGEFESKTHDGRDIKGSYGVSVKVGLTEDEQLVTPFEKGEDTSSMSESAVKETAEPAVDVFDEGDIIQIIAELPGIGPNDVTLNLHGDVLTIHAERGAKKFYKEMLLPHECSNEGISTQCNNGILEVLLKKRVESNE
ncbi:Hsp20 family protein [Zooshikella marina]|uniref:Hsp20 family protein n=1 Tax=Zooshikella ganghwensis TaxID=202772 RepID=UPI001BB06C57|nr:Hsp20 family protein [Zooshikella ganghwensis]MBU2704761.1 Hsp20 family protein [Zooshikella ganghwensis]